MDGKKETKMQQLRRKAREQTEEDVVASYRKYRQEMRLDTSEDGTPCPDCGGNGIIVKEIPILRVKTGKVCKTCGGSGYLPKEE